MPRLRVTRTIKWTCDMDEDCYPGMSLDEMIVYEKGLELSEVIELVGDCDAELTTDVEVVDGDTDV